MKSSETHAAKRPHMNAMLAKMFGQPYNCSDLTGGRTTQAESMPAVNSNISGKYFLEGPNNWGHGVS
jgi:hypothetical protein